VPGQIIKEESNLSSSLPVYKWRVDLMQSKQYWKDWFLGLTQQFLNVKIPKLLLLAEKERMDKDLTIANM
jgi:protein phosphatase methylesterase 1